MPFKITSRHFITQTVNKYDFKNAVIHRYVANMFMTHFRFYSNAHIILCIIYCVYRFYIMYNVTCIVCMYR